MWLRDALPDHITQEGDNQPCARIMIFGYHSTVAQSQSFQNLDTLASSFYGSLLDLISARTSRPVIFIAHSLGGLIVKQVRPFREPIVNYSHKMAGSHKSLQIKKGG
jgi:hypothetical protein